VIAQCKKSTSISWCAFLAENGKIVNQQHDVGKILPGHVVWHVVKKENSKNKKSTLAHLL